VNSWKVILATMLIFGTGVVTGGLLVRHSERTRAPHQQRPPGLRPQPVSPGVMRLEFLRRTQRELNLTPAQREEVERILKESQERSRKIMEPVSPDLRREVQRTKEEFRKVLTPEQQGRFDELLKQQQQRPKPKG
jgi:Spy/CpxP family protein refolding chaperone